jgi:hypothetical protein
VRKMRARARVGIPTVALIGLGGAFASIWAFVFALSAYPRTPDGVAALTTYSAVYLLALAVCIGLVLFDVKRVVGKRMKVVRKAGMAPISPSWLVPWVLSKKKYRATFWASAVAYGLFYCIITSMIVYQPGVDFARAYGVSVPSASLEAVVGPPLFTPVLTVYVADHLGLLVTPLTAILAAVVSILVGLNFSLAFFAFDSRVKGKSRAWVGGIGALLGLFTGCPTCAGLFFASSFGGAGAVSFAAALGYYQPAFILLSIPVLALTPFLISQSLSKVFKDGCVR